MTRKRLHLILLVAVITLGTAVIYGPTLGHEFLNLDDDLYVTANPAVQQGISLTSLRWALTSFYACNWHPLTWLSHMVDIALFGLSPGPHHLVNWLLHTVNALILCLLLRRLTGSLWRAALVAALFAWHPIHVESVAWVSERKDVLSTLWALTALLLYADWARRPRAAIYALLALAFALSLLAKPTYVTLPFVFLLLDYWPLGRLSRAGSAADGPAVGPIRLLLEKTPLLLLAGASAAMTFMAQSAGGAVRPLDVIPLGVRIQNALVAYVTYLGKLFWPGGLAVYYPHPLNQPGWLAGGMDSLRWQAALAACGLAALTLAACLLRRRRPYALVGWLWYLGTFIPMIGLVTVGSHALADRYAYFPFIGIYLLLAWSLPARWFERPRARRRLTAGIACALAALLVCSMLQVRHWRDSARLYAHTLAVTAGNALIHLNLGNTYLNAGRRDAAREQYLRALRIRPQYAKAYLQLGLICEQTGQSAQAARHFRQALAIERDYAGGAYPLGGRERATALHHLGQALLEEGNLQEAQQVFSALLAGWPEWTPTVCYQMARAYAARGDDARAWPFLEAAAQSGFAQWERLATDSAFKDLRDTPRFREWLAPKGRD